MPERRLKIMRVSTIPLTLKTFCLDLMRELQSAADIVAVSSPGPELNDIASAGIPAIAVKMDRKINPLSDLKSLWKLYRTFRRERPDMVHSLTPKAGLLSMVAGWAAGVPVRVHTFTGLVFPTATGLKKHILMATDSITCRCATHVHSEGEGVRTDLIANGITSKPVRVLGHGNIRGIDLGYFTLNEAISRTATQVRIDLGIPPEARVLLFVGRVVADKGIAELVSAFTALQKSCPDAFLLLVGNEEPVEDPLPTAVRQVIRDNPTICHVNRWVSDVRPYYAFADIFVMPSYREGFPNAVLEAGAMGLPSVVTDINGSREIITDGINGLIVPPHDTHSLLAAIQTIITRPDAAAEMGRRARENVRDNYEAGYVRSCLKQFYLEITSATISSN